MEPTSMKEGLAELNRRSAWWREYYVLTEAKIQVLREVANAGFVNVIRTGSREHYFFNLVHLGYLKASKAEKRWELRYALTEFGAILLAEMAVR